MEENTNEINFDDWTKVELYNYLVDLYEIYEEDTIENWDRIDLLEIARNLDL